MRMAKHIQLKEEEQIDITDLELEEEEEEEEEWDEDDELQRLEKERPDLYKTFTEVRTYLEEQFPHIHKLLESPMHIKDRAELIELFEVFTMSEPLSGEWLELKENIRFLYEDAIQRHKADSLIDPSVKARAETEIEKLKNCVAQDTPTDTKIALLDLPLEHRSLLYQRWKMLEWMDPSNDEYNRLTEWLDTVMRIPFNRFRELPQNSQSILYEVKTYLDMEFYGMESVKEQLLVYVNNRLSNPKMKDYALGLIGPPGIGKTSLALAISTVLLYPYEQLSGGVMAQRDGIIGHSYTYVGSQPGDIVKALIRMESMNGILFIDEFDKIPLEKNLGTLLQLLDPVQNHVFKDRYVGNIPIDLSSIWFILSMNSMPENDALRDRIFPVVMEGYSSNEKIQILRHHTLPRLVAAHSLPVHIPDTVLRFIVEKHPEPGMRQCINMVKDIIYKLKFIRQHPTIKVSFHVNIPEEGDIVLTRGIVSALITTKIATPLSMYG